jgi:hypothetical protein
MDGESETERMARDLWRAAQLADQQRRRVDALRGTPEFEGAAELLEQLEMALLLHQEHLTIWRRTRRLKDYR